MRRFLLIALPVVAVALMVLAAMPTDASWGGGACGPVGPTIQAQWPPAFVQPVQQARVVFNDAGCTNTCECGCWADPRSCKCGNRHAEQPATAEPITGVVSEKIKPGYNCVSGRQCSQHEVVQAIVEGVIPEDRDKLRITLVGEDSARVTVEKDLATNPLLTPMQDSYLLVSCRPDDYRVAGLGYVTSGKPTIYFQNKTGKVLHRQDVYRGAADFAPILREGIRRSDPNYDASKDPDLGKPKAPDPLTPNPPPPLSPAMPDHTKSYACCGLLVAIVWLLVKARKE